MKTGICVILNALVSSFYKLKVIMRSPCTHQMYYKIVTHQNRVTRESHKSCFLVSDWAIGMYDGPSGISHIVASSRESHLRNAIVLLLLVRRTTVPTSNWTFSSFITFQIRTNVYAGVWAARLLIICLLFLPKRKTKQTDEQTKKILSKIIPSD